MKFSKFQFHIRLAVFISALMIPHMGYAINFSGPDNGPTDGIVTSPDAETLAPIIVDGLFTGPNIVNDVFTPLGEWARVTPIGFISPDTDSGTLFRTPPGTPNSLTYAAVAPGLGGDGIEDLYLMYAYLPRTITSFTPGEKIADIIFPVELGLDELVPIKVEFKARVNGNNFNHLGLLSSSSSVPVPENAIAIDTDGNGMDDDGEFNSFFDVFVFADSNGDGTFDQELVPSTLGIEGGIGFGLSPLSKTIPHLLVELEIQLIQPISPNPLPPTSGYSPAPAFWGANTANDLVDPPSSAGLISISPTGATTFNASSVPVVPEPSTYLLFAVGILGIIGMGYRRRKKAA